MAKNNVINVRRSITENAWSLAKMPDPLFTTPDIQDLVEKELGIRPGFEFTSDVLRENFSRAYGYWSANSFIDD